jgi:hypothetical protein
MTARRRRVGCRNLCRIHLLGDLRRSDGGYGKTEVTILYHYDARLARADKHLAF